MSDAGVLSRQTPAYRTEGYLERMVTPPLKLEMSILEDPDPRSN